MQATTSSTSTGPWWKFGFVWMVWGGPFVVVVASFITLWLAISRPDPVLPDDAQSAQTMTAAEHARNHAQTGVPASKK
jgi:hypothetical protein